MSEVYLNGSYIGNVENHDEFVNQIKEERRKNKLSNNLNVFYNESIDYVVIESDKGRARRPLICCKRRPIYFNRHSS